MRRKEDFLGVRMKGYFYKAGCVLHIYDYKEASNGGQNDLGDAPKCVKRHFLSENMDDKRDYNNRNERR